MYISVKIPVQHFLKKFVARKMEVSPFQIQNKCHISALFLEPMKKDYMPTREELKAKFNDWIECQMNTSIIKEKKFQIDKDVVLRIDSLLKELFFDEMVHFVSSLTESQAVLIQDAIFQFMNYYDLIDDDIQFETLKKHYYRYRVPPKPIRKPTVEELNSQLQFTFSD
jgi:hypothetical protein